MKNFLKTMLVFLGVFAVVTAVGMLLTISGNGDLLKFDDILGYREANKPVQIAAIAVLTIYGFLGVLSVALSGNLNNDVKSGVVLDEPMDSMSV